MALFIVANIGSMYVVLPKMYVEQTIPPFSQQDIWTENSTIWTSNMPIKESGDRITGYCYGNSSIEISATDKNQLWMQLDTPQSVNCSNQGGYQNLSFRIKVVSPSSMQLKEAILMLYSRESDHSYLYNLTTDLTSVNAGTWLNLTLPIGPESQGWKRSSPQADWENITGVRFEVIWPEDTDTTLRLDGLFFRGIFQSESKNAAGYILNSSISGFMKFTIKWIIISGIIFLASKTLGEELVWRTLLIVVGFALLPLVIQVLAHTTLYSTLPSLYYPLEYFSGVTSEFESAQTAIVEQTQFVGQIAGYIQLAVSAWIIGLCSIALRLLGDYSWLKSAGISSVAYLVSWLLGVFLLGY